jgi:hypothetical protein
MKDRESNPLVAQRFNQLRHRAPNTANNTSTTSALRVILGNGRGIFDDAAFLVYDTTSLGYGFRRQFVATKLREQISQ